MKRNRYINYNTSKRLQLIKKLTYLSSAPQFPQELKAESRIISTASLRLLSASASERQGLTLDPVKHYFLLFLFTFMFIKL